MECEFWDACIVTMGAAHVAVLDLQYWSCTHYIILTPKKEPAQA